MYGITLQSYCSVLFNVYSAVYGHDHRARQGNTKSLNEEMGKDLSCDSLEKEEIF